MEEATQIEKDNEDLVQQMLRDAEVADVPSELKQNPVIHKGDEGQPAPMIVSKVDEGEGHRWIYDTRTGERIPCLYYMLGQKLRQRRPDGSFRFDTKDPGFRPKMGQVKCMLHEEDPRREHWNEMGFRTCNKSNIINQHQLRMHMLRRHPQEWAAIEQERIDKEKAEDRALQQMVLETQGKLADRFSPAPEIKEEPTIGTPDAPLYVSDKPKKTTKKK